jgi:hypothetical protein
VIQSPDVWVWVQLVEQALSILKERMDEVGLSESERVENAITKESMMKGWCAM